jgi:choice-of-anchor C domain-containing protein
VKAKSILATAVVGATVSLLAGTALAAPINTNGSFESGDNPGSFLPIAAVNNTVIDGWTVSSGNVDYIGTYWASSEGDRSIDLTGSDGSAGAISQTLTTVVGHTYAVTFDLAGNPDGGPAVKSLNVDAGGLPTLYTFDTTGHSTGSAASMGWTSKTFNFTATGVSTTLRFASLDTGFFGPALDNVVVNDTTNKDTCKNNGWKLFANPSFRNQGDCVSYFQSNPNAVGNRKDNITI